MHTLTTFRELPIYLLITSLAFVSTALPVQSSELSPDNFTSSIANGVWFIEFFSPYCGHCQAFAPTWEKLMEVSARDTPTLNLAQVNCVIHGDLCNEHGVEGYPTLTIYNNGKSLENFRGSKSLPNIQDFLKRHVDSAPPPPPPPEHEPLSNPTGQVLELSADSFTASLAKGPMFVKFFAPWCGHCKKLAPIWKQLARHMQNKLTIAQVNCDDNRALCKSYGVEGYPTLIYLTNHGLRSEYNGGRKLDQLKSFAEKASAAGVVSIKTEQIDAVVEENEVIYLLLHPEADTGIVETIRNAASPLLGSPMIFASPDPSLFTRYSIAQTSKWALVALKDHDSHTPSSIHLELTSSEHKLRTWLLTHRLPTTVELTQDTFQSVMNAPQAPLVVITAVTPQNRDKVTQRVKELGKLWRSRTQGSGLTSGKEVVFTWMDAENWKDWMKSMYGIQHVDRDGGLEDVSVVITDHKRLIYWDTDLTDVRISLAPYANLFAAVEAAVTGKLKYKNSENFAERFAKYLNRKMFSIEAYVVAHPWRTTAFVLAFFVLAFFGIKRLIEDDIPGDYHKVERLD